MEHDPEVFVKAYPEIHANFFEAMKSACNLSHDLSGQCQGIVNRNLLGSLLFTKICTSSVSVYKLCPEPETLGADQHWDYRSVASLTRDIMEAYLAFYYLAIDECPVDEWEARVSLMDLHDHISRVKMFDAMGSVYEKDDAAKQDRERMILALRSNSFFAMLSEKKQKHFLKGNDAFFLTHDEILERLKANLSEFRFKYRFLSNHTHSFPMGFYRMLDGGRGRGVESRIEVQYSAMCLKWVTDYLLAATTQYAELFQVSEIEV
ncbi:DUF5677 domain-containing protein [Microbulbifer sp. ZKSA006]|uniref:DUF5677 domain-containing protein n=1 Tax=Microbulbifer sp. ZKSA006 TaxID=3243390 RepID=UPI004039EB53